MNGIRKNPKDNWLPSRVYRGKSAYEYRPKGGGCIKLLPLPKDRNETEQLKVSVWESYKKANETKNYMVSDLIRAFEASPQFREKSARMQKDCIGYAKRIHAVFGKMEPEAIKPPHIRQFMDKLGEKYPVSANRHHSYLSILLGWALERGLCHINAASSVKKFREKPRDRYVEKWEFEIVYQESLKSSYPYIAHMMRLAYLCRMRANEVLSLTEGNILEDGVFVERGKGSENEITRWSPTLRETISNIRGMHRKAPTVINRPLLHDKHGTKIKMEAFKTAWQRVMKKALANGLTEKFTFHDLKAAGITDHKDKYGGHKSAKMQAVYDRKPGLRDATE